MWCWAGARGPHPFFLRLTSEWLWAPRPGLSAMLCAVVFLLPARFVLSMVLRDPREEGYRPGAHSAAADRRRYPVMFLSGPTPPDASTELPPARRPLLGRLLRLLLIASVLSLPLTGLAWWRGLAHADYLGWSGNDLQLGVLNEDGIVRLEWTSDEAIPAGWRAVSMPCSPKLGGWQSSWDGDLASATRVGGRHGVAWRTWRTARGAFKHGDRLRRSLYLSHPFLLGLGCALPAAFVLWHAFLAKRPDADANE